MRLFYGAQSGLEMLYMNDKQNDFVNYYDEDTFKAFAAVSPRPHMDDPIPLDEGDHRLVGNAQHSIFQRDRLAL